MSEQVAIFWLFDQLSKFAAVIMCFGNTYRFVSYHYPINLHTLIENQHNTLYFTLWLQSRHRERYAGRK
jgi:hypothetical protein